MMTRAEGRAAERGAGPPEWGRSLPGRFSTEEALAVLVHDLRSPLGVIRTALQVLRLGGTGPAAEQALGVMERQVGHMGRLVGDLLDLTRVTAGKLQLRPEWFDLVSAVGLAVETCRPLLEENRHRLTTSLPPGPVLLRADPGRLQQVLVNLLSNACKYTDPGGHVRLGAEAAGDMLVVRVRDNGMGIAPELLPRVFDLFRQGEGLGDRGRGGLGVGLALAKWLVELHGGAIAAHSDGPGKGSEFVVRLPVLPGQAVRKAPLALAPPLHSWGENGGGKCSKS